MINLCSKKTKKEQPCKNKPMNNSKYCYVHSLGKFTGVPFLKNPTVHLIIASLLTLALFFLGPSEKKQDQMIKNDKTTHKLLGSLIKEKGENMNSEINPIINITPAFKGTMTVADLLTTEGTLQFSTDRNYIHKGGFLCQLICDNFVFALSFKDNSLVFQRNETVSVLTLQEILDKNNKVMVFAMWTHEKLILHCIAGEDNKIAEVPTIPTVAPPQLIRWARKNNLIPIEKYSTEEKLRNKIHSCFLTINEKIREADAFKSFWNITYSGNKIIDRKPKKEVEIQPLIHCFLSDQMLLSNIEVIPEHKTGEGNLDFLFIGYVEGQGMSKFCAEFKLAHSPDLNKGLLNQLPTYMSVSKATYGAYCVLNYKGGWFDLPNLPEGRKLDIHLALVHGKLGNPFRLNIRSFIFDLFKIKTASKKP